MHTSEKFSSSLEPIASTSQPLKSLYSSQLTNQDKKKFLLSILQLIPKQKQSEVQMILRLLADNKIIDFDQHNNFQLNDGKIRTGLSTLILSLLSDPVHLVKYEKRILKQMKDHELLCFLKLLNPHKWNIFKKHSSAKYKLNWPLKKRFF